MKTALMFLSVAVIPVFMTSAQSMPPSEVLIKPNESKEWRMFTVHVGGPQDDFIDVKKNHAAFKAQLSYTIQQEPDGQTVGIRVLSEKWECDQNGNENDNTYLSTGDQQGKETFVPLKKYPKNVLLEIRSSGDLNQPAYTTSILDTTVLKQVNPSIYAKQTDTGPVIRWYWTGQQGAFLAGAELKALHVIIKPMQ